MPVGPATNVCPTSPMCVTSRNGVAPSVRVTISGGPPRWSFFSGPPEFDTKRCKLLICLK